MNIREQFDQAVQELETYRHPSLGEIRKVLDDILQAAKLGSIGNDQITSLDIYNNEVFIETSWSARGCDQRSDFKFPASILDAEDPVKAAQIWGINKRLQENHNQVRQLETQLRLRQEFIHALNQELVTAMM